MSYDLGVWDDPADETAGREADFYEQVAEGRLDHRPGSDRLGAFLAELAARWPGDTDEQFEDSPWSSWPLTADVSGPGTVLTMRWGAPEVRDIGNLAMQRGLVVYDPQANMVLKGHRAAAPVAASRWQRLAPRLQVPLALVIGSGLLALLNRCAS